MIFIERIEIFVNEEHMKAGLIPATVFYPQLSSHDEAEILEIAADIIRRKCHYHNFSKGVGRFEIKRVSKITVYAESEEIR